MKSRVKKLLPLLIIAVLSFSLGALFVASNKGKPITRQIVSNAEKIIGIDFTDAEQDSMLDGLEQRLENYTAMRKVELKNSVPPAILFNPIPEGFKFPEKRKPFVLSDYSGTEMPQDPNDLAYYNIGQLAHLLKTKQVTSVELTKLFLTRLKKYGPELKCVITLTEDEAMREAKHADAEIAAGHYESPLMGIPYGVKDLLATKGYKTTWGAAPYKDQKIDEDARVIKDLRKAGAVLIAKLSMGALAWGDVWYGGKTRDPWDTTMGSSGSSAGPAAAVSAGLVPFAIGTETWGSIVSPSTRCGDTGLRPTYGRVSRTGAMALSWSMDKIGPICRSVEDCAIVFNAIYGPDGKDQTLYDLPFNYTPEINLKGLRIGYLKNEFDSKYAFKKEDSLTIVEMKKLGAVLVPIKLPEFEPHEIAFILDAEACAAFDDLTRSNKDNLLRRQVKNAWPNVFRAARFIPAAEYINANRIRYLYIQDMQKIFEKNKIDLYLAPSITGDNSIATNLTGHPLVVVPNGFMKNGLPTSITFVGKLFDEARILAVAKAYQDATGFQLKHPPMFK